MQDQKKKVQKSEKECALSERMCKRLHQSYNIECPKCKIVEKNTVFQG